MPSESIYIFSGVEPHSTHFAYIPSFSVSLNTLKVSLLHLEQLDSMIKS